MKKLILIALAFAGLNASAGSTIGIKPIVNSPSCFGGNNGTVTLVVTGGTAPYTYHWTNSLPDNATQSNLNAGTYSVTVVDANSQQTVYSLTLAQPAGLHLSTVIQNVSAHGGSDGCITLNVNGGTPDYSYHWSNNANIPSPCGLAAGIYQVTVTDAFGCTSTTSAHVQQPAHVVHNNQFNGNSQNLFVNNPNENHGEAKSDITSISDNSAQTDITADDVTTYPNPASNSVTVRIENATNADLTLINTLGQTVIHTKTDATETGLDLSGIAKGNYILSVKTETSTINKMVVVAK